MTALKSFRVARFELILRALDAIKLPPHAGSTFRGGFGRAFRRIGCAASALDADPCTLGDRCPYHYIFENPVPPVSAILEKVGTAPRPFVIELPLDGQGIYEPGALIPVGVVLVGRAIEYLPYFIYAFEHLGEAGLGPGRGRFRVDSVSAAPIAGPATVIYERLPASADHRRSDVRHRRSAGGSEHNIVMARNENGRHRISSFLSAPSAERSSSKPHNPVDSKVG